MKIAMLSTGEEVLHGDIVDTNAAWLSSLFYQHGFGLTKRSTVGDKQSSLIEEFLMLSFNNDVVIVNGGLGPTTDDMSAAAAAKAAECKLVLFKEWLEQLESMYARRGIPMPDSNLKQAMLPETAEILANPIGTACGFKMLINDAIFYFTPGVPSEFKLMAETQILPDLRRVFPDVKGSCCSRIYTFGLSESGISDKLDQLKLPQGYELGYRSYLPFIEVKLFGPADQLEQRLKLMQLINKHLESNTVSIDLPMVEHVGQLLADKDLTLSVSEKSSAGYLTYWLNSDENAEKQLGHGWVLAGRNQTVNHEGDPLAATFALAGATREKCATDLAIVTGQVEGGVFSVALSTPSGEWGASYKLAKKYQRDDQVKVISTAALDLLRRYLERKPMFAHYAFLEKVKEMHIPNSAL
ncbi:CinA family nicotinamide mononucleotide deamidase-related protein [Vibrio parahaemolyticus]|uniref:CinA family nicotinamide mononucleotide deamidase-related protein n=1 Tax=Vibrio parahaemolyticus TaxID=670 RepID=UPI0015B51FD2|nr:CinA family nicotinamide mononucleotide deamidase-related protein [Vibrio parahaemolyticus]EIZ1548984.1 CinA family nicotinamide mononucleotide deamidase-related protein [Vibrio parahaemolyticus]MCC3788971.1 CinA family nicotinamide mononucleotide deamidase-related protein [Vibrio parahaemolyticus]MCC3836528.1 CinA family nicotinamide mononucleotide deamidase-related protein [Vibrio parahaemolyticus]MCC3841209.1 CinA family nicotinamide mononucleotide deamidase-related protein [Vibrio paraha